MLLAVNVYCSDSTEFCVQVTAAKGLLIKLSRADTARNRFTVDFVTSVPGLGDAPALGSQVCELLVVYILICMATSVLSLCCRNSC